MLVLTPEIKDRKRKQNALIIINDVNSFFIALATVITINISEDNPNIRYGIFQFPFKSEVIVLRKLII